MLNKCTIGIPTQKHAIFLCLIVRLAAVVTKSGQLRVSPWVEEVSSRCRVRLKGSVAAVCGGEGRLATIFLVVLLSGTSVWADL